MKNVHYINAGAGAGKTHTLVTILKEKLTDPTNPCDPSEIILTTYTKAAAKEFREKTFQRLLENFPALHKAKILDTATIGTVHSVAEIYIQRYWSLLGFSGQFSILSDTDKYHYINHSLHSFVSPNNLVFFKQYADKFNLGKDDSLYWKNAVVDIASKIRSYNIDTKDFPVFCQQSRDVVDRLFVHTFDIGIFKSLATDYIDFLDNLIATGQPKSKNAAQTKRDLYDVFCKQTTYTNEILKEFVDSGFFKYQTGISPIEQSSGEDSKKHIQKALILNPAQAADVKKYITLVFDIAKKWSQYYADYKIQNNLLDFDDLEFYFLKLLDDPAVVSDIEKSIKYLFVDEFQDSNPIQLKIFQKLSEHVQQSYWVGDPKQAIYGFRGSDSSLTTELLKSIPAPVKGMTSGFTKNADNCSSQLLDKSYRSIDSLVGLANEVFDTSFQNCAPSERIKDVRLDAIRPDKGITNPIRHWHCEKPNTIANRIANILNGNDDITNIFDESSKTLRPVVPSDIAILCRTGLQCTDVAKALRDNGIPVALPETKIIENAEVRLVFAFLKYIKRQRYAKAELAKLWEDKNFENILKDIVSGRYDYNKAENVDGATSTTAPVPTKDTLYQLLDDRLQSLHGLNVSAMVKGIIAAMDLYNIVTKWGNAETRRNNLDTLIQQAIAYEQLSATTTKSAGVYGFINYMKEIKIEQTLDKSAEGVKVASYHKSKGLQWPIVILYSLDNDALKNTTFVGNEWVKLNLKKDTATGKSELQLIPPFGFINEGVAEEVEILSNAGAGNDDNGYYAMRHDKVDGEIRRLLYVGLTRARDYLITVSVGKEVSLSWIKNVIGRPSHPILDNIANQADKSFINLWNLSTKSSTPGEKSPAEKFPVYYEILDDKTTINYAGGATAYRKLKEFAMNAEKEPKTLSPSKIGGMITATATLVPDTDFTSQEIKHGTITDAAEFGTCIHNYFAAHVWDGSGQVANRQANNIALAKSTVANHGKQNELPKPELLTSAADTLFTYLEKTFGAGELLRECPFTYCRDNGQLVSGEIDLVWKLGNGECILIDYKNFPATGGSGKKTVLDNKPDNAHYVGHYFPQLNEYKTALEAAGLKVKKVYIFYAVLGCLVEVEF